VAATIVCDTLCEAGGAAEPGTCRGVLGTRSTTEVSGSSAGIDRALEEDGVLANGTLNCELVEGHALATSSQDASTSSLGEAESADGHLGEITHDAVVIDDSADGDNDSTLAGSDLAGLLLDRAEVEHGAVDLGGHEAAKDDLVELCRGASRKEAVELHKELAVDVGGLGVLAVRRLDTATSAEINTLYGQEVS